MIDKAFVDINVLVYADAGAKHDVAVNVLRELWSKRSGALSPQVLQEFYVNVTWKISTPVSRDDARSVVRAYSVWSTDVTPSEISTAFRIEDEARLGFWNALIIASALKAGATRVLPEDLNAGQVIAGVKIHNPFR